MAESVKPIVQSTSSTPVVKTTEVSKVQASATPVVKAPEKKEEVKEGCFKEDSWMYHKDFEPKLFKKGEKLPNKEEGWDIHNRWHWFKDINQNFIWRKKKL